MALGIDGVYTITIFVIIFVSCYTKNLDTVIPSTELSDLKDVETVAKEEEQRLKDLHENPEFEELRIIDDPLEIPKILAQPTNEHGDVIQEFNPISLPVDFESYDVAPKDGCINLSELVAVTGVVENVEAAFNASDTDRDGVINLEEFRSAPWSLGGSDDDMGYYDYMDYSGVSSGEEDGPFLLNRHH